MAASGYGHAEKANQGLEEDAEVSKAQRRRERQRLSRAAAAQKKAAQAEQLAQEQFLRETAAGFLEREDLLEPTDPKKVKEPKAKAVKETAQNELAEDLLVGLWNAKLRKRSEGVHGR